MRNSPLLIVVILASTLWSHAAFADPLWSEVEQPSEHEPEVIGSYTNGCLLGGEALPINGPGYQVMRTERNRNYGHPRLVEFVQGLGKTIKRRGLGVVLVGDLAQPMGGPSPSSHVSHQNGLDVDLWFWAPTKAKRRRLSKREREVISARSTLRRNKKRINRSVWTRRNIRILKLAAQSDDVERIMVNPVIKRDLCRRLGNPAWLGKIRPWWGHDDHFHVRLSCPEGDSDCISQTPPARGSGCDKLGYWFKKKPKRASKKTRRARNKRPLPPQCAVALHDLESENSPEGLPSEVMMASEPDL